MRAFQRRGIQGLIARPWFHVLVLEVEDCLVILIIRVVNGCRESYYDSGLYAYCHLKHMFPLVCCHL